jgi:hypothetical protein
MTSGAHELTDGVQTVRGICGITASARGAGLPQLSLDPRGLGRSELGPVLRVDTR